MKTTINFYAFAEEFKRYGRGSQFTYEGLKALFDFLEQLEEDIGEEIELDVIALCCDYAEESWQDIAKNYSIDFENCEDDADKLQAVEEYLQENTMLVGTVGDSIIYAQF